MRICHIRQPKESSATLARSIQHPKPPTGGIFYFLYYESMERLEPTEPNIEPTRLEVAKALIPTAEQMHERIMEGYVSPYVFTSQNNLGDHVIFYGSRHLADPDHPMFQEIRDTMAHLEPQAVFVEGMSQIDRIDKEKLLEEPDEVTIRRYSEPMFVMKEGLKLNAEVISPEVTLSEELIYLLNQGFDRADIFNYYMLRQIPNYARTEQDYPLDQHLRHYAEYVKSAAPIRNDSPWKDFDYREATDSFISGLADEQLDPETAHRLVTPSPWLDDRHPSTSNEISWSLGRFRDEKILESLESALGQVDRVMIVYGSGHAVALEPAIKYLVENQEV